MDTVSLNVVSSLIAAVIFSMLTFVVGRIVERRVQLKRFYGAAEPVLEMLADLAAAYHIQPEHTQRFVRTFTAAFSTAYLRGPARLPLHQVRAKKSLPSVCGICRGQAEYEKRACVRCKLDCSAWDIVSPCGGNPSSSVETELIAGGPPAMS